MIDWICCCLSREKKLFLPNDKDDYYSILPNYDDL